jgi:hypothetical protein
MQLAQTTDASLFWLCPALHSAQYVRSFSNFPFPQLAQTWAPGRLLNLPSVQLAQTTDPSIFWLCPALHGAQYVRSFSNFPFAQLVHLDSSAEPG